MPDAPSPSTMMPPPRHRIEGLDALRGIAAMAVVFLHLTTDFNRECAPDRIASISFRYGPYGVHLFYLISGFVIFMTVERAKRPRDFAISRFSRLYPTYWVAVVLTSAIMVALPTPGSLGLKKLIPRAVVDLTMFQSWVRVNHVDVVYWTLQVEMSFYLIMLILIWRKAVDWTLPVLTGMVVLALGDHMLVPRPVPAWYDYIRGVFFLEYVYLFTVGVVLFRSRGGWKASYAAIILLCVACPATAWYRPNNPPQDTAIVVGLIALVYLACSGRLKFLANPVLLHLGAISYSLYLTHHWLGVSILYRLNRMGIHPDLALFAVVALCLLVATAMQRWVEVPSQRWIRGRLALRAPGREGLQTASGPTPEAGPVETVSQSLGVQTTRP